MGVSPGVPHGLPQGRAAARPRLRPARIRARHRRLAAAARGLPLRLRAARARRPAAQRQRRHRRLQRVRLRAARCSPSTTARSPAAASGVDAKAFDADGNEVVGELGELVITEPMPSMPVALLERPGRRALPRRVLRATTRASGARATGSASPSAAAASSPAARTRRSTAAACAWARASSTRSSRSSPEVADSLVVHLEDDEGGAGRAAAVRRRSRDGAELDDDAARADRAARCASELSPRHVPDTIAAVPAIPRTLTGKKLEAPVKRILRGARADAVASRDALADPTRDRRVRGVRAVSHARRLSRAPVAADYNRDIFVISVSSRAWGRCAIPHTAVIRSRRVAAEPVRRIGRRTRIRGPAEVAAGGRRAVPGAPSVSRSGRKTGALSPRRTAEGPTPLGRRS